MFSVKWRTEKGSIQRSIPGSVLINNRNRRNWLGFGEDEKEAGGGETRLRHVITSGGEYSIRGVPEESCGEHGRLCCGWLQGIHGQCLWRNKCGAYVCGLRLPQELSQEGSTARRKLKNKFWTCHDSWVSSHNYPLSSNSGPSSFVRTTHSEKEKIESLSIKLDDWIDEGLSFFPSSCLFLWCLQLSVDCRYNRHWYWYCCKRKYIELMDFFSSWNIIQLLFSLSCLLLLQVFFLCL